MSENTIQVRTTLDYSMDTYVVEIKRLRQESYTQYDKTVSSREIAERLFYLDIPESLVHDIIRDVLTRKEGPHLRGTT